MRQAYNSPYMRIVPLKRCDIITNASYTLSVDFSTHTDDPGDIGAPDRIRDDY